MKLRIKGNSLRLRVTRSELDNLASSARIEKTIHFADDEQSKLTYALERSRDASKVAIQFRLPTITVILPAGAAESWRTSDQIGIYATVDIGSGSTLEIIVEKDFACLHGSDEENADCFPNPLTTCQ